MAADEEKRGALKIDFNNRLQLKGGVARLIHRTMTSAGITGGVLIHVDELIRGTKLSYNTIQLQGVDVGLNLRLAFRVQGTTIDAYNCRAFFTSMEAIDATELLLLVDGVSSFLTLTQGGLTNVAEFRAEGLREVGKKVDQNVIDQTIGLQVVGRFAEGIDTPYAQLKDSVVALMGQGCDIRAAEQVAKAFATNYLEGNRSGYRPLPQLIRRLKELDSDAVGFVVHTARLVGQCLKHSVAGRESLRLAEVEATEQAAEAKVAECQKTLDESKAALGLARTAKQTARAADAKAELYTNQLRALMAALD